MTSSSTDGTRSFRYERKFVIPPYMMKDLPEMLKIGRYRFKEIFSEREVHNLYLDTPLFRFYKENVQGISDRKKIRLRWYGSPEPEGQYRLEIKRKSGLLGMKDVYELNMPIRKCFGPDLSHCKSLPADTRYEISGTHPMLKNSYKRRYFLSADGMFRITLDYDIRYSNPVRLSSGSNAICMGEIDKESILELKYDHAQDGEVAGITNELPLRLSKKSKYVSGVECIYEFLG